MRPALCTHTSVFHGTPCPGGASDRTRKHCQYAATQHALRRMLTVAINRHHSGSSPPPLLFLLAVGGTWWTDGECGVPVVHRFRTPSNGNGVFWYSFDYSRLVHVVQLSSEHALTPGSMYVTRRIKKNCMHRHLSLTLTPLPPHFLCMRHVDLPGARVGYVIHTQSIVACGWLVAELTA